MKTVEERLNDLFSNKEFLEQNKDKGSFGEIYAAVAALVPGVTEEELDAYLGKLANGLKAGELSEDDLENVSGGIVWAAVGTAIGIVSGVWTVGTAIGRYLKGRG